jgi:hypothetical protein
MPIILLRRLRQKDLEFKARLGYIVKPCFKGKKGTTVELQQEFLGTETDDSRGLNEC